MITECANQLCGRPFRYFRGGKLFIVDVGSNTPSEVLGTTDPAVPKLEHFWLCERCAATMTLVVRQGKAPRQRFRQGAVSRVDKAARMVTIKSEDGAEQTYHVAKEAAIDREHGVVNGSEHTAKKGERVTVRNTDEAGTKVAHVFQRI